eukprot:TRINITY_DN11671_c0_g1_i1.p1 TRINITY_DN11671_c0_g1~~TRINITY_DN11671_c0_g1_i1.p1  ORF type:complete len:337 (-),score=75.78 TRINITY_DN11671_c0_g1_i1:117-1007(-)
MALYSPSRLWRDCASLATLFWTWILSAFLFDPKTQKQELSATCDLQIITAACFEKESDARLESQPSEKLSALSPSSSSASFGNTATYRKLYSYIPYCIQYQNHPKKKLVLDLDETLISSSQKHAHKHDIAVKIYLGGSQANFYVRKRPHVDYFLETVSQWFELVIFTASLSSYANAVIDELDPEHRINRRYYRQSCVNRQGSYIKDLSIVCKDLSKVAIIDNSPVAYSGHRDNAIPIEDYVGNNHQDEALLNLIPLLKEMKDAEDVRHTLRAAPRGLGSSKRTDYSPVLKKTSNVQ